MTAGGEKIQRYWLRDAGVNGAWMTSEDHQIEAPDDAAFVLYADHRAALIGELNGLAASFNERSCRSTEEIATVLQSVNRHIHARIAELEKEGK